MKLVHSARQSVEAHLVRGFLDANGIDAEVRGEYLTSGLGELPAGVCGVWVDDALVERAAALVHAFLNGAPATEHAHRSWRCACGEAIEGQFTACWKCAAERPVSR